MATRRARREKPKKTNTRRNRTRQQISEDEESDDVPRARRQRRPNRSEHHDSSDEDDNGDRRQKSRKKGRSKRSRRAANADPDAHRRRRWLLFKNNMRVKPLHLDTDKRKRRRKSNACGFCLNYQEITGFVVPAAIDSPESDEPLKFSIRASLFDFRQRRCP